MLHRFISLAGAFFVLWGGIPTVPAEASERPLKVVATQNFFADLVRQVGRERVEVKSVASPKFNVHFIQPKPSDIRNLAKADLYVSAGLDLEAWSGPLVEAAGRPEFFRGADRSLDLSQGIRLLDVPAGSLSRAEGDVHLFGNPHYHMNPENAVLMIETIRRKLCELDPGGAAVYDRNAEAYLERLRRKISEWKALCSHCAGQEIYSYHKDIGYFAQFLDLRAEQTIEPKPGIPPTPKHLEFLKEHAQTHPVKAVVLPTYYSRSSAEALSARIGVPVVTVLQNPGEVPGTEEVLDFFDTNVRAVASAMQ